MARLIKFKTKIEEGELFNRWLDNRFKRNKNVLTAITGPTGSSKSYQDLRRAELWYKFKFNKEFPTENICFSVGEVIRRLKDLHKGSILIFEEAGANLGSLDFQNRVSKLFTYVLQSFRSMNVALFFNLPYLSMLNKSARMLIHVHFQTCGIDQEKKLAKSKAFFIQINQQTGKVYPKYLRARVNGKVRTIKRFNYNLPSVKLIESYERKKIRFVSNLTSDFIKELDEIEKDQLRRMGRKELTYPQRLAFEDQVLGLTIKASAKKRGKSHNAIWTARQQIKKKGYSQELIEIAKENPKNHLYNPYPITI